MNELLVIHAVRPDRLLASSHRLVAAAFGDEFMQQDKVVSLREIVENEVCHFRCKNIVICRPYDFTGFQVQSRLQNAGQN